MCIHVYKEKREDCGEEKETGESEFENAWDNALARATFIFGGLRLFSPQNISLALPGIFVRTRPIKEKKRTFGRGFPRCIIFTSSFWFCRGLERVLVDQAQLSLNYT